MDILGVLAAVIAVAVFPGGAFLLTCAVVAGWTPGGAASGDGLGWTVGALTAGVAVTLAAALLPLPGSPAAQLPPDSGVLPNLAGIALLVAVALTAAGDDRAWTLRRRVAAAAVAGPMFAVGTAAASLAFPVVLEVRTLGLARVLAGTAMLVAAPVVIRVVAPGMPGELRGAIFAVMIITGAVLVAPSQVLDAPGIVVAGLALMAVALMAAGERALRGPRGEVALTVGAMTLATVALVASMVASR